MIAFLLTFRMLGRALRYAWRDPAFQLLVVLTLLALLSGMLFYHWVEGWGYLDSLYFSVITLSTVGYGDLVPTTPMSKLFTIGYVFLGIGLLVSLFTRIADALVKARQEHLAQRTDKQE